MAAAILTLQTIPLAGFILAGTRERWHDLFVVCHFSAVGLLLSGAAMVDDYFDLTDWIGICTENWPM